MRGPRKDLLQGGPDIGSLHSNRKLQLSVSIRGGDDGRVCSIAAANDVRHRDVRQDAEAEFRCRMGQARDPLRVRVPRRLQTRLRRHGCESKGPNRGGWTFGGSYARPRAERAQQRASNMAADAKGVGAIKKLGYRMDLL